MEFAWGFVGGMAALAFIVRVAARVLPHADMRPPLPRHRDLVLMPQEVARLVRGFEVVVQQPLGSIGVRFHISVGGLRGVEAIVAMARRSDARGTGEPDGAGVPVATGSVPLLTWTSLEPITEAMLQCPDCRELTRPCEVHATYTTGSAR